MNCHLYNQSAIQVCTVPCTPLDNSTCPVDASGVNATCNNMGNCKTGEGERLHAAEIAGGGGRASAGVAREAAPDNAEPTAPAGISDADLAKLAEGEANRDLRRAARQSRSIATPRCALTGEQLAARGATDLGTALAVVARCHRARLPGAAAASNVDIRGARARAP